MTLLVVGLSHHSAPVSVLERTSIPGDDMRKVLDELHRSESVSEVVALSTCNRIEIYADVARFHPAVIDISTVLCVPDHVDVRKVDLAAELQILSFHDSRRTGRTGFAPVVAKPVAVAE